MPLDQLDISNTVVVERHASFNDAVAYIGTATKTLIISEIQTLFASVTVPSNTGLCFVGNGQLTSTDAAVTVTINGPLSCAPLKQIFAGQLVAPDKVKFGAGSPVAVIFPQWWGARDGADSTEAFRAAFAATQGSPQGRGYTYSVRAKSLYIPAGVYTISQKHTFRLLKTHTGVIVYGAGPYSSILEYTDTSPGENYLFYHDRVVDGPSADFTLRDVGILGPGPLSPAGVFFLDSGPGGSGQTTFENVRTWNFREGITIVGQDADGDKFLALRWDAREVGHIVTLDNSQSMSHSFIHCFFVTPAGSNGEVFNVVKGGWISVIGSTITVQGTSSVVRFPAGATTFRQPIRFISTYIELAENSLAVSDDDSGFGPQVVVFIATKAMDLSRTGRSIATLRDGGILIIKDGSLVRGGFTLIATAASNVEGPPRLKIEDSIWEHGSVTESFSPGENAIRPVVQIRDLLYDRVSAPRQPPALDRDTGGMTGTSPVAIIRRQKVFYLSKKSLANTYVLPTDSQSETVTIPDGSNIVRIRLVCFDNHSGTNGSWVVTNEDGSKIYIKKTYTKGETAFIESIDTTLQLREVGGRDAVVKITGSELTIPHLGYVEITYY